jgi:hypothetical protein
VSSSSAFKWILSAVLLLSIAWKISVPSENQTDWTDSVVKVLERNHFDVVVTKQMVNYVPLIQASKASCHLQIARIAPDGVDQDLVRHLTMGTDRLFIVFRGRMYTQQPIFWIRISYLWLARLREIRLTKHIPPVIAVITNSSCDVERLPWDEFGETY